MWLLGLLNYINHRLLLWEGHKKYSCQLKSRVYNILIFNNNIHRNHWVTVYIENYIAENLLKHNTTL